MKLKNIAAASLLPLNVLLLFFLIVFNSLAVPSWLQVFGRLHPLILHFPIVLILAYAVLQLLTPAPVKARQGYATLLETLLLAAAFSAVTTALMGILLAREPGYDADSIALHKYTGAFTAFALFGLYHFNRQLQQRVVLSKLLVACSAATLLWAGHLGGDITHGDNFVLGPVTPDHKKAPVAFEDAYLYADLVQPVFEEKCYGCHNSSKEKGGLVMETKELLLKGGKDGKLWDTTQPDMGLLMKRVHLPEEEKEHMPPSGKPQLTDEEKEILFAWIKEGASFDKKITDLPPTDTLFVIASRKIKQSADEQFDFAAADDKEIQKLSNNNRVITPLAIGSPALAVTFYNKPFYNKQQLEELKSLGNNITQLNLDNMPVKDEDLAVIGDFRNLRKLNLDFTDITGKTLGDLKNLTSLKTISLSGTKIQAENLSALTGLPKLKHVYIWSTDVTDAAAAKLAQQDKSISWFTGFKGDTVILKLTPPILQNDNFVITQPLKLQLKTYLRGVSVRYTTDGKDPDSLNSSLYDTSVVLNNEATIKAKAFKPGWISSDVIQQHFFKSTYVADSAAMLTPLDVKYRGNGAKSLIDLDKSDLNFANGKWVGYSKNDMLAVMFFNNPIKASSITFSALQNTGASIFPPVKITIWGGASEGNLKLLGTITPTPPTKDMIEVKNLALQCNFSPTELKVIKFQAVPVAKLPAWHQNKGKKGWVFIDEVFVN
ncbi:MAG TPA: FN3 associated domain-containing protein [Chitinophagaceae bacterium]|nr:FN3 associated domain-containing protein [Chitinophagaceae bacterium]